MDHLNPTLAQGDLLELSPLKEPCSILKPSQKDNLIQLQTPVHKNLKVQFMTPKRTPVPSKLAQMKYGSMECLAPTAAPKDNVGIQNGETAPKVVLQAPSAHKEPLRGCLKAQKSMTERSASVGAVSRGVFKAPLCVSERVSTGRAVDGGKYSVLQELDAEQRWKERVEVITKLDHAEYTSCARECVGGMITNAMNISESKGSESDSQHYVTATDASFTFLDTALPIESTPALPSPITGCAFDFNDAGWTDGAKLLQGPEHVLDLDFLEKKTSGEVSADLRKQSLYLKFDPLLEDLAARRSILLLGRKSDIIDFTGRVTPVPEEGEDTLVSPREPDLLCDSPSEINENITFNASQIPRGSAGDSVSSASPGVSMQVEPKPGAGIIEVLRYSEDDLQRRLAKRRRKWIEEQKSAAVRQEALETDIQNAEVLVEDYARRYAEKKQELESGKEKADEEMKTLQQKKVENDKDIDTFNKGIKDLTNKRDSLQKILGNLKSNSATLTLLCKKHRDERDSWREKTKQLVESGRKTVEEATGERKTIEATHKSKMAKLNMQIKSMELNASRLQAELERKKNENSELMKIADDFLKSSEVEAS